MPGVSTLLRIVSRIVGIPGSVRMLCSSNMKTTVCVNVLISYVPEPEQAYESLKQE